jgi:hypothetical protein
MAGSLELPLAFHGHMARLQASPMEGGGWDVHASVDGQDVAHVHCSDWNRVERFRSRNADAAPKRRRRGDRRVGSFAGRLM